MTGGSPYLTGGSPYLRSQAAQLGSAFPPLLAQANQLAQTLLMGGHGRKRAGRGEEFWQYRPAQVGDPARAIDWRRSAHSDGHFIREQEWQAAQTLYLWCDGAASMRFASTAELPEKSQRAAVLTLALSLVLMKGNERVALLGHAMRPRTGARQISQMSEALSEPIEAGPAADADLDMSQCQSHSQALFLSDFLGPIEVIEAAVRQAAERGMTGVLYQVLDPAEEQFPFEGRTIFEAMSGGVSFETLRAADLKSRYLEKLAERRDALRTMARTAGWHFGTHTTDAPAHAALLWLFQTLEGGR